MRKTGYYLIYLCIAVLSVIGVVVGRSYDLNIAQKVYSENEFISVALSVLGVYLYYGSFVFFIGVLGIQLMDASKKTWLRILIGILFTYMAVSTSTYGAGTIISRSVCGFLFPDTPHTIGSYALRGLYLFLPLYPLGLIVNGQRHDKEAIRTISIMLVILTIATFSLNGVKGFFMRPRYRITLLGYEGVSFVQVFNKLTNGKELISRYGLESDDLASFYSGHAMNAVIGLIIIPCYRFAVQKLRNKEKLLAVIACITIYPIMFSRMVLGDHYLSDVSMGAFTGLIYCVIFTLICGKSSKKGM